MHETEQHDQQTYSERFVEMASKSDRLGILEKPDGRGKQTGECGDTVEIFLSVRAGQIRMVTYQINGCLNTVACTNALAYLVEGRSVVDSWEITPENLINFLETLPADHHHCAELVVGTFYKALNDYNLLQREPWRKDYSRR
jgi:nitrogen fixation protein NifU and related proteins